MLLTDAKSDKILFIDINEILKRKGEIMKRRLEEITSLLVVIDMVNGFVREGKMADPYISHIIPENIRLIKMFLEENQGLAFIKDCHTPGCREFDRYPVHCLKGTKEADLIDELLPYEKDSLVYTKNSTSAIWSPNFMSDINKMTNLREIVFTGCCSDICDLNAIIPLQNYFDEINRRIELIVPTNAIETYNSSEHNREEYNEIARKLIKQSGVKLVKKYERLSTRY